MYYIIAQDFKPCGSSASSRPKLAFELSQGRDSSTDSWSRSREPSWAVEVLCELYIIYIYIYTIYYLS